MFPVLWLLFFTRFYHSVFEVDLNADKLQFYIKKITLISAKINAN